MATTSIPTTFQELYTDLADRVRVSVSDAAILVLLKRYINAALQEVHIERNWPWAERRNFIQTNADYAVGTVAIALTARTTVTGTDSLWNTAVTGMGFNNTRAGGKLKFAGADDVYEVSSVGSDTAITLVERFVGTAALTTSTYVYFEDEYALETDFWRPVDLRRFTQAFDLPIVSRKEFYRAFPKNSTPGTPRICTIIDLAPSGAVGTRPRLLLAPPPTSIINIPYRYITTNLAVSSAGAEAVSLSADADEPIIPVRYRNVLVHWAAAQWYRDRKDDTRYETCRREYMEQIVRMGSDTGPDRDHPKFLVSKAPYLRNVAGGRGGGSRRYVSPGSAFDELRA